MFIVNYFWCGYSHSLVLYFPAVADCFEDDCTLFFPSKVMWVVTRNDLYLSDLISIVMFVIIPGMFRL